MLGHVAHDGLADGADVADRVGLVQHADPNSTAHRDAPAVGLETPREHREQAGLAVAVAADDADAIALVDAERDRVEDDPRGEFEVQGLSPEKMCHVPTG